MNLEHERARKLLRAARVEGISAGDRYWLDAHLAECGECAVEASALAFAVDSLRAVRVSAGPDAVRRARGAVRRRAEEMRAGRERALPLWIAAAISSVSLILTAPYAWSAFAWLGRSLDAPDPVWQVGFLMWWFLPATVLGAVAGWQHVARADAASTWAADAKWR